MTEHTHASTKTKPPVSIHTQLGRIPTYMAPCTSPTCGACLPEPYRPLDSIVSRFRGGYIKADADKAPKSSRHTIGTSSDSPSLHQKPPQPPCPNKRDGVITGPVKVMGGSKNGAEQGARLKDETGRPGMVKSEGETPRARGKKRNKKKGTTTKTNASRDARF